MRRSKFVFIIVSVILTFNSYAGGFINGLNLKLDEKLFVFSAIGASKLNINESLAPNTTLINGALDKAASIAEIGVGFKHNKKMFSTLAIQKSNLEIANIYNVYGSINYQFPAKKMKPFIGALAGYSQLKWSTPPHQVQLNKNTTSKSFMYGLQFGVKKMLKKNLSVIAKYQFIKHNHRIEIIDNTSNIEHNAVQNFLLGVQYHF